jgi:tetratricopeptide (TPR) repeat protein
MHLRLGQAHHSLGQYSRAMDALRKNVQLLAGDMLHDACYMAGLPSVFSRAWLAICLAERGEFGEALATAEEALRIAETGDPGFSLAVGRAGLGNVCVGKGDFARAAAVLEPELTREPSEDVARIWPFVASALGAAYARLGRVGEGLPLLESAVERAVALKLQANHSHRLTRLAEAHLEAGQVERAFPLAAHALDLAQEHRERGYEAHALRLLAAIELAREAGDLDRAEESCRKALSLAEQLGMRPLQAHCHRGLARMHDRRGASQAAATATATARDLYHAMDMTFWLREPD